MLCCTQAAVTPLTLQFASNPANPISSSETNRSVTLTSPAPATPQPSFVLSTFSSSVALPQSRSPSSWIQALRSKTRCNLFREAVMTFVEMINAGVQLDSYAFPAALKAATALHDFELAKQIHAHVVKFDCSSSSVAIANSLVHIYGKNGDISDVYRLFDGITERDQVSWNSLIAALCGFEEWSLALDALRSMLAEEVEPSSFTWVSAAHICSNLNKCDALLLGKQVHAYSLRRGDLKTHTNNALMAMYAKLGRVRDSKGLFEVFDGRDLVSWNTLISSFSQSNLFVESMEFLRQMLLEGIKPDGFTVASVLPACTHLEMLDTGREIHAYALRNTEIIENSFVGSALVDLYCNCRAVEKGRRIFDRILDKRIAVWNAMIAGYAQNEHDEEALSLFIEMKSDYGIKLNTTTLSSILPACARCEAFSSKEAIHGYVIKRGFCEDKYVQNALMDMYSRMGQVEVSKTIFDSMTARDVVSWNTIMTGYVICGQHDLAITMLRQMQTIGGVVVKASVNCCKPNSVTLMTILPGCATLVALAKGKEIHAYSVRNLLATDVAVGSALVDMYAKCGCLKAARAVFDQMPVRNVITWNVLVMAYGMHGKGKEAVKAFKEMVGEGGRFERVRPNEITFITVLAACSHSGMVQEGMHLFRTMRDAYGVEPDSDHYACVVDLLGRAGQVEEAYSIVNTMPSQLDKLGAWSSLLGACRIHKKLEIGETAARSLIESEPGVASHYVLLANLYSSTGLWDKAMDVRRKMKEMGVQKEPGCSWIEFEDEVHKFVAGDTAHPQNEQLHGFLQTLSEKMRKEGYVPDTSCVHHNVEEGEKESLLCGHSEKLAIAFGILNTRPGTVIRVAKNLRVCNDCHNATKFISKIAEREIVVRDVRRFHHFRDGACSCQDYW